MISPDATIADVWSKLATREKYVATVLGRMHDCAKEHGNASVRIGFKGTGKYPCFRVCYTESSTGQEEVFGSFVDSGKAFPPGFERIKPGTWSTKTMTRDELLTFCAEQKAAL